MAGWLQAAVVLAVVLAAHVPLGDYMARAFSSARHWRAEREFYRACGIDPETDQTWADLSHEFNQNQLIELPLIIGHVQGGSYLVNALRIPLEPGNPGNPKEHWCFQSHFYF